MKQNEQIAIFWFRRDLRLSDNHGLYQALKCGKRVMPIFIFDTDILHQLDDKADRRVDFIFQALEKINQELKNKYASGIHYFLGKPEEVFLQILDKFNVLSVFCNQDYEPYPISRDKNIKALLEKKGVAFHSFKDHVIFHKSEIVKKDGKPYTVYTPYANTWLSAFRQSDFTTYPSEKELEKLLPLPPENFELSNTRFMVTDIRFILPKIDNELISDYNRTRDMVYLPNGTSRLGVHLRFGTISIRQLALQASLLNEVFLKELVWREFFMQILYHFPHVTTQSFKPKYDNIRWENNEKLFQQWCEGKTGYPLVDAGMRELNTTGFMHNRARMVVAGFLVKHLLIDWRWGEAYFANKLLDYELASNNGNWQWAAGSGCDAAPYFRIFNPYTQLKKFDPQMQYVQKWIPELNTEAYPKPIIEHTAARKRTLQQFKTDLYETAL